MDGFGIRSILAAFFILFYPEIVDQGMVYIADPPLYQIDYKPQEYVTSKKAYLDICEMIYNKQMQHVEQDDKGNWVPVKDSELFRDAVAFNRNMSLTGIYRMHPDVIFEIIKQTAQYLSEHDLPGNLDRNQFLHVVNDIKYKFTGQFREIYYEKRDAYIVFSGVYNLIHMGLDFNYANYIRLTPLIMTAMRMRIWERIYVRNKKTKEVLVGIAEDPMAVIQQVTLYMPKILDRMKGLGQTDSEILARTTLNPATRTLIQINLNHDFQTALEIIKSLRGDSIEDLKKRKEMILSFDIDIDDIDT